MTNKKITINLKAIRQKAGVSLAQAAELTGVSKAMLHQIERGDSSPTIATLWKLASGFHLPLTAFIENLDQATDRYTPADTEPVRLRESLSFQTLFPFDPRFGSETYLHTLEPGQSHTSNAHEDGVVEDVFVVRGFVEVLHDGEWKTYKSGDAVRFRADQPHGYRNPGSEEAQFHNTMHYPQTIGGMTAFEPE